MTDNASIQTDKMIFQTLLVAGFEPALSGMRNPLNSWDKADSLLHDDKILLIGQEDMKLARKLIKAGSEHRKFLRMIQVWVDVSMPLYWWSEADTYHFGTKNSCSTMHKLMETDIGRDDFALCWLDVDIIDRIINRLRTLQFEYKIAKEANDQDLMTFCLIRAKRILPTGFIQKRTWNTNYEEVRNIYRQRCHHRLKEEWIDSFCKWAEELPYFKEMILDK